ncbi:hypothetical protein IMCC3317_26190 [Kordia antarctica]|uniref:Uncharacterized protein n=1 Tax=Kordia antarctica TaxID=1218801 RepID=A0A7L4ZL38_9FLAO|nr:hypothetical protein [Kordia antarctica]QHI37241.1 hypothetical protein IMCC3317_26190 [Kordia antarctica]
MKKIYTYLIVFLCVVSFHSCGKSEGKDVKQENIRVEKNRKLFLDVYDTIAFKSIDLVLVRNYDSLKKPNILGITLDSLKSKINGEGEVDSIIRTYIDSFKAKRDSLLENRPFLSDKRFFEDNSGDIVNSKLIADNIYGNKKLGEDTKRDSLGEILKGEIKLIISKAVSEFQSKTKENETQASSIVNVEDIKNTNVTKIVEDEAETDDGTKNESMLLYIISGILGLSVLLNIFLGWKLSKRKTKKTEVLPVEAPKDEESSENSLGKFDEEEEKEEEQKPISRLEIQNIVATEHKKMLNNLSKYSKACLETVDNLESTKSDVIEIILKRELLEIDHVKRTAAATLDAYEKNVVALLQNCNNKNLATQKINKAVDLANQENFGLAKLHLVPKQEIDLKIELRKNNLIGELPPTITTEELTQKIKKLIHTIKADLSKLIEESLIYYLPFSDANGYFKDNKKSKKKKPDSIIKMHIDPDNQTKATFQFMYEEKNTMKNAILSYDVLLMPICILKSENFNRQGTVVEQIGENGTLQLVDDLWQVEEKLNIKIT